MSQAGNNGNFNFFASAEGILCMGWNTKLLRYEDFSPDWSGQVIPGDARRGQEDDWNSSFDMFSILLRSLVLIRPPGPIPLADVDSYEPRCSAGEAACLCHLPLHDIISGRPGWRQSGKTHSEAKRGESVSSFDHRAGAAWLSFLFSFATRTREFGF